VLEIEEDDSASSDEIINEIIVKGKDQTLSGRGNDIEARSHNNAARQDQGAIQDTLELPGISTRELAFRRGQMELAIHAPGLKRFKLKFDRRAWGLTPAAVVRISAPSNSIGNMVVRIGDDIDYGNTTDGTITTSAVEDVFGLPTASFQSTGGSIWTDPNQLPAPAAATRLIEAGYRDILRRVGTTQTQALDPTAAFIGQLAKSPGTAYRYDLLSKTSGETDFVDRANGIFTFAATLSADVAPLDTAIIVTDLAGISADNIGEALWLGDEAVRLDAVDAGTSTLTVARGCADTIPAPHSAGDLIWLLDDDLVSDGREYVSSETVQTKVLTRTTSGVLDPALASIDSDDMVARHYKPYPPGNVKVDGTSVYSLSGIHATPVLTFVARNRLTEDDQLIEHGAGAVTAETGTTYTVVVKSLSGTVLRTTTGITASTWTYDGTMQAADGSPISVLMELWSVRDGVASWQTYSFEVQLQAIVLPSPLASLDFKTGTYTLNGVSKTLADVVEHNTSAGPFNPADVVSGTGLTISSGAGSLQSFPALTAAAFDAVTVSGTARDISVVMTVVATTTDTNGTVEFDVSLTELSSFNYWTGVGTWGDTAPVLSYLQDSYDSTYTDWGMSGSGTHKAGYTFAATGFSAYVDGVSKGSLPAPTALAYDLINLAADAYPDISTATAVIEKVEFFAAVDDATLQALTT
jgi:hypothetical protein